MTKRCALLAAALLLAFMGCDTAVSGVSLDTPSMTLNVKAMSCTRVHFGRMQPIATGELL